MRILLLIPLLIPLFGYCTQAYGSFAKTIENELRGEVSIHNQDETYLQKQVSLASQLEDASSTLKAILLMDPDGRIKKDLGSFKGLLACAIEVVNTGIATSTAGKIQGEIIESSRDNGFVRPPEKRKSSPPPLSNHNAKPTSVEDTSDVSVKTAKADLLPSSEVKPQRTSKEKSIASLKRDLDKLTNDLGQEFMMEVFYPWFQEYRKRLSTRASTNRLSFQHALLLCALETAVASAKGINKERKKMLSHYLPSIDVRNNPFFTRAPVTWQALSTILASGLNDLGSWTLPTYHEWAQPVFDLLNNERVQNAYGHSSIELAKGFYNALSQPHLELHTRVDLFFYLIDPEASARTYLDEILNDNVDIRDSKKQTPLMWAAIFGHVNVLLTILQGNEDEDSEDTIDESSTKKSNEGEDALMSALNEEDADGLAAIDYACFQKKTECIDLLMNGGSILPKYMTLRKLVKQEDLPCLRALLKHMEMPADIEKLARDMNKTSVIELFKKHAPKKKTPPAPLKKKGWRKKKVHAKK